MKLDETSCDLCRKLLKDGDVFLVLHDKCLQKIKKHVKKGDWG